MRLFPDINACKQTMFGPIDPGGAEYVNPDRNIFTDGIKRISAALTASILIGQLAQITEQAKHSETLEQQALSDLDRLLKIPDLTAALQNNTSTQTVEEGSFFFEEKDLDLMASVLRVEVYIPNAISTGWQLVNNYSGSISTGHIVADIADTINTATLVTHSSNILAAPVLAEGPALHRISFKARSRDATVSSEVVMVRAQVVGDTSNQVPFRWGASSTSLRNTTVNSLLLVVQQGKASTTAITSSARQSGEPTVLYFRRAPISGAGEVLDYQGNIIPRSQWAAPGNLTFRISPTMPENRTVTIPYTLDTNQEMADSFRPSIVAETLLNQLFTIKGETRALGALIRNDNPESPNALVALELIAFSVTNPETWMILDVMEIPPDVQVAVGNLQVPLTPFSSRPRSIRVESQFRSTISANSALPSSATRNAMPTVAKIPVSEFLRKAQERSMTWRGNVL